MYFNFILTLRSREDKIAYIETWHSMIERLAIGSKQWKTTEEITNEIDYTL